MAFADAQQWFTAKDGSVNIQTYGIAWRASDPNHIWVVSKYYEKIYKYDLTTASWVMNMDTPSKRRGLSSDVTGIAFGPDGYLWVADSAQNLLYKVDADAGPDPLMWVGLDGTPIGLGIDLDARLVYVSTGTSTGTCRIKQYDLDDLGSGWKVSYGAPDNTLVTGLAVDDGGRLWVQENTYQRIYYMQADLGSGWAVYTSCPATQVGQTPVMPTGLAPGPTGYMYAADYQQSEIFKIEGYVYNTAPNAPTLTAPIGNKVIDVTATQRLAWQFSDPDAGDSQSKFDLRYRATGAANWTTISSAVPNAYWDAPAGTFVDGTEYEWQVRTYDSQGAVGPYSSSEFFTGATPPASPSITYPTDGASVAQFETVQWSVPDQDGYQFRRVADNGGTADTSTIYQDTGEVDSPSARSRAVEFDVNNRTEHVQIRVVSSGLWSPWTDVLVNVAYTPPPTPTVALTANDSNGTLVVAIQNPAPGTGEPATSYNDVYVNDGDGEERRATNIAPNGSWTYWTPVSGRDYTPNVRVVAHGDNGSTSSATAA